MFIRRPPSISTNLLPNCGSFKRIQAVIGLFDKLLLRLEAYEVDDYLSDYFYLYNFAGLSFNVNIFPEQQKTLFKNRILALLDKYQIPLDQKEDFIKYFDNTSYLELDYEPEPSTSETPLRILSNIPEKKFLETTQNDENNENPEMDD